MTTKTFLEMILSKRELNEFETTRLCELITSLSPDELEALSLRCAFLRFINLKEICNAYFENLNAKAKEYAATTEISNFKGTRLEQKELLAQSYIKRALCNKPKWLIQVKELA